jgi:hypothetical protein
MKKSAGQRTGQKGTTANAITPMRLAQIKIRLLEITSGQWIASEQPRDIYGHVVVNSHGRVIAAMVPSKADADFIVHAAADIAALLFERDQLLDANGAESGAPAPTDADIPHSDAE